MNANNAHPLKTAERAAHDAFAAAMRARDAIESCCTPEWRAAHQIAKVKSQEWHVAQQAVYDAGVEFAPYWWVRPGAYGRG